MPEETKKEKTVEITRDKFRSVVMEVMAHGKFADAMKESPIMLLVVPLVGSEIEQKLFGAEEE